jgi:cytochrome c biogenesis protein
MLQAWRAARVSCAASIDLARARAIVVYLRSQLTSLDSRPATRSIRSIPTPTAKNKQSGGGLKPIDQQSLLTEAPDLSDDSREQQPREPSPPPLAAAAAAAAAPPQRQQLRPQPNPLRAAYRRVLRELASLPRAIAIMAAVTALGALGTVVPQNKPLEFYEANYPQGDGAVLGFLSYDLLLACGLDHVYSASYFYALLALLAASLAACTATTQWPAAKVAQRWRFARDARDLARLADGGAAAVAVLPRARLRDVARELRGGGGGGYQTFVSPDGRRMYAFKGLAGRLGPIGVHAALLLTLFGTAYSGFGGWRGTAMVPEGQAFVVADRLVPVSPLSRPPEAAGRTALYVNGFSIDTRPDGSVAQFYSDLSLREAAPVVVGAEEGEQAASGGGGGGGSGDQRQPAARRKGYVLGDEVLRKRISVNDPFRYGGVTMYQTDWSLVALQLRVVPAGGGGEQPPAGGAGAAAAAAAGGSSASPSSSAAAAAAAAATAADSRAATSAIAAAASAAGDSASARAAQEGRPFSLPLASLEGRPGIPAGSKIWATYLPLEPLPAPGSPAPSKAPRGVSIIAKDPYLATFYTSKGEFAGVRRAGSGKPIDVEGVRLVLERVVPATGLELKCDPGVPFVYAGFGGLMVTTLVSYVSHSQVWALQRGRDVLVGGRSNRAKVGFARDLAAAADRAPEIEDAAELAALDALGREQEAAAAEEEAGGAAEEERARRAEEAEVTAAALAQR